MLTFTEQCKGHFLGRARVPVLEFFLASDLVGCLCSLLVSTATFLEQVQTSSRQFSVLLRWRGHSRILRDTSTGHSLGSGHLAWKMVSRLLRVFYTHHWNCAISTLSSRSSDDHDWGITCWSAPRNTKSGKMSASGRLSTLLGVAP